MLQGKSKSIYAPSDEGEEEDEQDDVCNLVKVTYIHEKEEFLFQTVEDKLSHL